MVTFRVINNVTRPFGSSGVSSSSIGAPIRSSASGATPRTFGGKFESSGGIFSAKHAVNRLLTKANEAQQQARSEMKEAQASRKSQDTNMVEEETETLRKQRSEEQQKNIRSLKERIAQVGIGKTKEDKKRKEEMRKEIQEVLNNEENLRWKTENFNISGSTVNALRLQAALKGDKEAQEILLAIGKHDWKKANKLIEQRDNKLNNVFSQKSKEESEKTTSLLEKAGYVLNSDGQYVPSNKTPEIASDKFDIPISQEENQVLKENPVQAPPVVNATEVAILSQSVGGRERLREWGYAV